MSLLKKLAASIGFGTASFETVLEKSTYCPGEEVRGTVHVQGGSIEQQIEDMNLSVMTRYRSTHQDTVQEVAVHTFQIVEGFTIQPKEIKSFPFYFLLPLDTPASLGETVVWMKTTVGSVQSKEHETIQVQPHPWTEKMITAIRQCGFTLRETDCEHATIDEQTYPFVQVFSFVPATSRYRDKLGEVKLVGLIQNNQMRVLLDLDRNVRKFLGQIHPPTILLSATYLEHATSLELAEKVIDVINRYIE